MDDGRQRVAILREDEEVAMIQARQDLELFGKRAMPVDPEESSEILAQIGTEVQYEEHVDTTNATRMQLAMEMNARPQPSVSHHSYNSLDNTDRTAKTSHIASRESQTPMELWLDVTEASSHGLNTIKASGSLDSSSEKDRESMDIEIFRRVHVNQSEDNVRITNPLLVDDVHVKGEV